MVPFSLLLGPSPSPPFSDSKQSPIFPNNTPLDPFFQPNPLQTLHPPTFPQGLSRGLLLGKAGVSNLVERAQHSIARARAMSGEGGAGGMGGVGGGQNHEGGEGEGETHVHPGHAQGPGHTATFMAEKVRVCQPA